MWNHSSSASIEASGRGNNSGGGYPYIVAPNMVATPYGGGGLMATAAPLHDRSHEVCKYFVNGGCLRGNNCPYSHELPDERHLDVTGQGFILNPNVHNAQKTVTPSPGSPQGVPNRVSPTTQGTSLAHSVTGQPSSNRQYTHSTTLPSKMHLAPALASSLQIQIAKLSPPPKYIPPEPYLEYNLPPNLALQVKSLHSEQSSNLADTMLQS